MAWRYSVHGRTVSSRRARLASNCTYRAAVVSRLLATNGVRVTVAFLGNTALLTSRARSLAVRG